MREITADQESLLAERGTVPIYLIDLGDERLSTNGDRVIDDVLYAGGDAAVAGLDNWTRARIRLNPSSARVQHAVSDQWRGLSCRIQLLPAVNYRQLIEPGYYEEGTAIDGFYTGDPIVLLDGVLVGASMGAAVEFDAAHRAYAARWVPPIRITAPWANHLPKPGAVFLWQGDNYTLEAR